MTDRPVRQRMANPKYTEEVAGDRHKSSPQGMLTSPGASVQARIVILERKFDELVKELKVQKSEDEQDREFQKALKERVRRLEESEKRLVNENARLKEELENYKRMLDDNMVKVDKEKNDFKELISEESEKFKRDLELRKTQWNETKETEIVGIQEIIQEQLREEKEVMAKKMVDVMKNKETLIREIAEKKV